MQEEIKNLINYIKIDDINSFKYLFDKIINEDKYQIPEFIIDKISKNIIENNAINIFLFLKNNNFFCKKNLNDFLLLFAASSGNNNIFIELLKLENIDVLQSDFYVLNLILTNDNKQLFLDFYHSGYFPEQFDYNSWFKRNKLSFSDEMIKEYLSIFKIKTF